MAVRKIRGHWYVDFRWQNERLRRLSPLNTKGGAETYEAHLRQLVAQHRTIKEALLSLKSKREMKLPTLKEFSERWFVTYVDANNRPYERRKKREVFNHDILPFFGRMQLDEIRASAIDRFAQQQLARGLKAKTVNNHLSMLRTCLATAVKWEELNALPQVTFLTAKQPETRIVQASDIPLMLSACPPGPWRALVFVAWRTGLRFNELIALEWSVVDLDRATLLVRLGEVRGHVDAPKSDRCRRVYLTSEVVSVLRELPRCHVRVFTYLGRSVKYSTAWKKLRRACVLAGVPHTSWHPFRHTFATDLNARGAYPQSIQQLLGHSTLKMTERYIHPMEEVLRSSVGLLETRANEVWASSGHLGADGAPRFQHGHYAQSLESQLKQKENAALARDVSHGAGKGNRTVDLPLISSDPESASSLC